MTEHHPAERPRQEPDRIGRKGGDDAVQLVARLGKEELAEHQRRGGAIEEEFIPFDDRSRHGGADDLLQIGQVGPLFMLHNPAPHGFRGTLWRSEEHTSELQSLMRISYAVFCLKQKKNRRYQLKD